MGKDDSLGAWLLSEVLWIVGGEKIVGKFKIFRVILFRKGGLGFLTT